MRSIAVLQLLALFAIPGLCLPESAAAASAPLWRVAAREAWVRDAPPAAPESALPTPGLVLRDRQIRLTAAGDDRYEHTIQRLSAAQTGEDAAQVNVTLDPRFQELVIHSLRITHAADTARVFTAAQIRERIRTQPAEADPHKRELNPRLQVSLQVPGVEPGDILECEFTVHSQVSRFAGLVAGHYAAQWPIGADQPVRQEHLQVSWPLQRSLQFRLNAAAAGHLPQIHSQPGELEIQWRNLLPAATEADTPRWFERQGLVQLSDFTDWAQVATLLAPRYAPQPAQPDPADQDQVPDQDQDQGIAAAAPEMILNALRLVQGKVHAINAAGSGPYAPADPAVVLQRGFGDSRDLARLLASLLQRLGIDAQVALADSRRGVLLESSLPSPFVLNSGLVLARVGATQYWLNPAAAGPAAALATTDPADLRHALILANPGGRLVALPQPAADSRLRLLTQRFDLHALNAQAATLTETTQFHGDWAQAVRANLLTQSPAQLQLTQLQGVVQDYPDATPLGEVQLQDLAGGETVQLTAQFHLPRPFGPAAAPQFSFFAEALAGAVQPRDEATRQFPLSLPWPLLLEQHIEATLPANFAVPAGRIVIENAAFRYQRVVRFTRGMLSIDHSYMALADHVDPADYPRFLAANAQVYQALALRVRPTPSSWRRAVNRVGDRWLAIAAAAALIGMLAVALWRRLRRA